MGMILLPGFDRLERWPVREKHWEEIQDAKQLAH